MSLIDIYWKLKKVFSLKGISYQSTRTYSRRSYYFSENSIQGSFFLFNFATDIILIMPIREI